MSSMTTTHEITDVSAHCVQLADAGVAASRKLMTASGKQRNEALFAIADAIEASADQLKQDNALDLAAGRDNGLSSAMLDRLELTDKRIASMVKSVREIAAQEDPVGKVETGRVLESGIRLQKVRVPIGVVLIIFESRPNVTSDAAALCLKSGNAVVLRGGKEAMHSNAAIAKCVAAGLEKAGLDPACVQLVSTTDRSAITELLHMEGKIDLCIPRGGEGLIRAVVEQARIPVIKHYTGNCHTYVDADCSEEIARKVCINAKVQRTGVCNATETILFHQEAAERGVLTKVCEDLAEHGVEIRGCARTACFYTLAKPASDEDWATEYLDKIVAIRVVDDLDAAADHINQYGSKHTDAILTASVTAADEFIAKVDTANVFVNCSTRFSDGGVYGLGAEIGISTDKLHSRGPMGADDLTTYKWVARGEGQIRE